MFAFIVIETVTKNLNIAFSSFGNAFKIETQFFPAEISIFSQPRLMLIF